MGILYHPKIYLYLRYVSSLKNAMEFWLGPVQGEKIRCKIYKNLLLIFQRKKIEVRIKSWIWIFRLVELDLQIFYGFWELKLFRFKSFIAFVHLLDCVLMLLADIP